ncbi:CRISPR-associated endonuclease Cas2 [Candidatus Parcubacteria bacterium]|nr:MAG: CRISPR-associated endonuclease Cas2 [Candidatus Parcubacteria bacterium]
MAKRDARRTLYVVAYDIPNNRRRTKIHKLLSGYGEWTQYSLFECYLSDKELLQLRHRLEPLLDAKKDSVRFYPLCASCASKVDTVGSEKPREKKTIIL